MLPPMLMAVMTVRTAHPGTPPAVIPAKAGIHTAFIEHGCAKTAIAAIDRNRWLHTGPVSAGAVRALFGRMRCGTPSDA